MLVSCPTDGGSSASQLLGGSNDGCRLVGLNDGLASLDDSNRSRLFRRGSEQQLLFLIASCREVAPAR